MLELEIINVCDKMNVFILYRNAKVHAKNNHITDIVNARNRQNLIFARVV